MPGPPKAQGSAPDKSNQSWLEHAQKEIQTEPARLEETAKFLVGIISISLTIFISKQPEGLAAWTKGYFIFSALVWMLATLLSFFVLYPWRYSFNPESPTDIQRAYQRITTTKRVLLTLSIALFLAALGLATYAVLMG